MRVNQLRTLAFVGLLIFTPILHADEFVYGQCLIDKSESFDKKLRDYRNVAFAKAAIKKMALEHDRNLLKWNFETARLVYDLVASQAALIRLKLIYNILNTSQPAAIEKIQSYLSGTSGHLALAQLDDFQSESDEDSMDNFVDKLDEMLPDTSDADDQILSLRKFLEKEQIRDALGDLYDKIQEASVGATPLEPQSIDQWIQLGTFFRGSLATSECQTCEDASQPFNKILVEWNNPRSFPSEENFDKDLKPSLPPLLRIRYPKLDKSSVDAIQVVEHYYTRTIEDFLFGRSGVDIEGVRKWLLASVNSSVLIRQADQIAEFKQEPKNDIKVFKYIMSQDRVQENAFDHFVWQNQEGSEEDKAIDGVARTIYGEAESCQVAGTHQFEAIGSIIAARSVAVDQENQSKNIFTAILDYAVTALNKISPIDLQALFTYKNGASDFGRANEVKRNPVVSEMPTPARVVSKPIQFSVWKIAKKENLEVSRWIRWPDGGEYPDTLKVIVSAPVGKDLDPAQRKVLCPNHEVFKQAVDVARGVVKDYVSYANTYRFYQGNKRVVPYFYTHGPRLNLYFASRISPMPNFVRTEFGGDQTTAESFTNLPLLEGDINCRTFKLYKPKTYKDWTRKTAKGKAPTRGRRRHR